jgi:hypothetical protein
MTGYIDVLNFLWRAGRLMLEDPMEDGLICVDLGVRVLECFVSLGFDLSLVVFVALLSFLWSTLICVLLFVLLFIVAGILLPALVIALSIISSFVNSFGLAPSSTQCHLLYPQDCFIIPFLKGELQTTIFIILISWHSLPCPISIVSCCCCSLQKQTLNFRSNPTLSLLLVKICAVCGEFDSAEWLADAVKRVSPSSAAPGDVDILKRLVSQR